jgi:hypothetical protein
LCSGVSGAVVTIGIFQSSPKSSDSLLRSGALGAVSLEIYSQVLLVGTVGIKLLLSAPSDQFRVETRLALAVESNELLQLVRWTDILVGSISSGIEER